MGRMVASLRRSVDGIGRAQVAYGAIATALSLVTALLTYADGQPAWVVTLAALVALASVFVIAQGATWAWGRLVGRFGASNPIAIGPDIFCQTQSLVTPSGTEVPNLRKAGFSLVVANNQTQTLRNVQARLHLPHKAYVLRGKFNQPRPDIQHGEYVFFEFGWIATDLTLGSYHFEKYVQSTDAIEALVENHRNGHSSLTIATADGSDRMSVSDTTDRGFPLVITISADDVESKTIRYRMHLKKLPDLAQVFVLDEAREGE